MRKILTKKDRHATDMSPSDNDPQYKSLPKLRVKKTAEDALRDDGVCLNETAKKRK